MVIYSWFTHQQFYIKHLNLKYAKWVFDRSKHSWFKHIDRTDHEFGCGWKWWLTSKIAMSTIGGSLFSDRPLEMSPGRNSKPSHCWLPFGKRLHNYGKSPCSMGKSTISMAIFTSYAKLPEGRLVSYNPATKWGFPLKWLEFYHQHGPSVLSGPLGLLMTTWTGK